MWVRKCSFVAAVTMVWVLVGGPVGAPPALAGCSGSSYYHIEARDLGASGQTGVKGEIWTQHITNNEDFIGRSIGIRGPSGAFIRFGWAQTFIEHGPIYYFEWRNTSGQQGADFQLPGPGGGGPLLGYDRWIVWQVKDGNQDGRWTLVSQGETVWTTDNLGFSAGRPFSWSERTNCDGGGNAQFRALRRCSGSCASFSVWADLGCFSDTDSTHHMNFVTPSDSYSTPSGESAPGCAGTT